MQLRSESLQIFMDKIEFMNSYLQANTVAMSMLIGLSGNQQPTV